LLERHSHQIIPFLYIPLLMLAIPAKASCVLTAGMGHAYPPPLARHA
jgi:hypothetical protein